MIELNNIRNIYVLGDLHLGIRNNSVEWSEIQCDFLLNFFISEIERRGFDPERDILLQVGDWNHVRESTNVRIWNKSLEIFKTLSLKFKRGIYIILGNHDVYYKDQTHTHSLKGIDEMFSNIHIFEKPELLKINGKHKFLLLPWIEKVEDLKQTLLNYSNKAEYVFCHADIKGFQFNKFAKLEHGLEEDELSTFKMIYSGHIHIRQRKGNMCYVGTPYQMDKGDRGNTKGFYLLNVDDTVSEEFIENTLSPKYVKFDAFEILNLPLDKIKENFKNNFVDIALEHSFTNKFPITRFTELIESCGHRRLEFFTYSKEETKAKSEIDSSESYEYNLFDILVDQVKEKGISSQVGEKVTLKFHDIYNTIKSNSNNYQ